MEKNTEYDNELEYPLEISKDPYAERTVYDIDITHFKNLRKKEKTEENIIID